jgi:hypothetical protein
MRTVRALVVLAVFVFSTAAWAQKVEGTAPANTVPVVITPGSGGVKTIIGQSPITAAIGATGLVNVAGSFAVTGMISATSNITAGGNIVATGNVSGASVSATAGNVTASLDVIAGGNVKANAASGTVSGFFGDFEGTGGGVVGRDTTPAGGFAGIIGIGDSSSGLGIQGAALACDQLVTDPSPPAPCDFNVVSGRTIGVQGFSRSPLGVGVEGRDNNLTGSTTGVVGVVRSLNGIGVFGLANSRSTDPTAGTTGVRGQSNTHNGLGVAALAEADNGIGVRADSSTTLTTSFPIGLLATVRSSTGVAALFEQHSGVSTSNIIQARAVDPVNAGLFTNVFRVDSSGNVFALGTFTPSSADFAESLAVAGEREGYQPGDVLAIDPGSNRRVALAHEPYSPLVAGIYSTKPGVLGSPNGEAGTAVASEVPMAIVGIVPCKVTAENGEIKRGDLLVASSKPGRAMKGTDRSRMLGAVLGKALEPLASGEGVIQVLVTLQ